MQNDVLTFGIIGFGKLAQEYYVPALRSISGIRVGAIADPLLASREAVRRLVPEANAYSASQELFENEGLDAVLVASPPSTHLGIWREANALKVPVFMEKPFILESEISQIEEIRDTSPLLMVNFNRRFWPTYQHLKGRVARGEIGIPTQAEFKLHVNIAKWCSVTQHRLNPMEGGVLFDLGSQVLDLALTTLGEEPVRLEAKVWKQKMGADHIQIKLLFSNGCEALCDVAYGEKTQERVVVQGTQGELRLENPNMIIHFEPKSSPVYHLLDWFGDVLSFSFRVVRRDHSMLRFSVREAIAYFVRSLQGGYSSFSPGLEEAVTITRYLTAAIQSATTGKEVSLSRSQ